MDTEFGGIPQAASDAILPRLVRTTSQCALQLFLLIAWHKATRGKKAFAEGNFMHNIIAKVSHQAKVPY